MESPRATYAPSRPFPCSSAIGVPRLPPLAPAGAMTHGLPEALAGMPVRAGRTVPARPLPHRGQAAHGRVRGDAPGRVTARHDVPELLEVPAELLLDHQ